MAGSRPEVAALLKFVPAGAANGKSESFTLNGQTHTVPLGDVTGSSSIVFNQNQFNGRVDHEFTQSHRLAVRYLGSITPQNCSSGQVTPPGLTTVNVANQHSVNSWLTSDRTEPVE